MGRRLRSSLTAMLLAAAFAAPVPGAAAGFGSTDSPFLPADQAFQPDAWMDGETLTVAWRIATGYYLYDHALDVRVDGQSIPVTWPAGEAYHDEHFGAVTIYRDQLFGTVTPESPATSVTVHYQGCADAGLCYPPMSTTLAVVPE